MSYAVKYDPELEKRLFALPTGGFVNLLELAEELPHGSGIDCKWHVEPLANGNILFRNEYHAMNDCGYYDGYYSFTVRLFRHKKDVRHPLCGPCAGKVQVCWRKGDWDFKVTGINSRKYHDVLDSIYGSVYMAWEKYGIGKMRHEQEDA